MQEARELEMAVFTGSERAARSAAVQLKYRLRQAVNAEGCGQVVDSSP